MNITVSPQGNHLPMLYLIRIGIKAIVQLVLDFSPGLWSGERKKGIICCCKDQEPWWESMIIARISERHVQDRLSGYQLHCWSPQNNLVTHTGYAQMNEVPYPFEDSPGGR